MITDWSSGPDSLFDIPADVLQEVKERVASQRRLKDKEIVVKAMDQAKTELIKKACLHQWFADFQTEGKVPFPIQGEVKQIMDSQAKKLSTKSPYCLLTVNPFPATPLQELRKVVKKFLSKKTITAWFLVFEVRAEEGKGLHAHILLRYTPPPFDFKRSAKNTFKKVCDSKNASVLNFKFIPEELLADKIAYMLGSKKSAKQKGVLLSRQYRAEKGLDPFEESSPPLTCRATVECPPLEGHE